MREAHDPRRQALLMAVNLADLGAPDMHAIAMAHRVIGGDLEADELVAWVLLALDERRLADEVVALRLERHGKADAGLEGIGLVGEFVVGEDETSFDTQHI